MVLSCFRSKILIVYWFYYVFVHLGFKKPYKTNPKLGCFACLCVSLAFHCVFTQKCRNVEKPLVLLCFRSQMLQKHLFCCVFEVLGSENIEFIVILLVFCSTSCVFNENPCAKMQKKQKSEKSICFSRGKFFECIKQ